MRIPSLFPWVFGFLLGCGASRPEVRHYTLSLPLPQAAPPSDGKTVLVRHIQARAPYGQERMVYRSSPYRIDYYNYHQWASTPADLVAEWTLRYLRGSGLFAQVVAMPGIPSDLLLGGVIREFEEVDDGTHWEAVLGVDFWLARGEGMPPLWHHAYHVSRAAARRNPEAVAEAMSHNLEQVLQQVSADLAAFAH